MSKLTNYNGLEAANLFLGQAGFDFLTTTTAVVPSGFNRWVSILILQETSSSAGDVILLTETGDDLTIDTAWVSDLVGTMIYGPFISIDAGNHDIIAYRG